MLFNNIIVTDHDMKAILLIFSNEVKAIAQILTHTIMCMVYRKDNSFVFKIEIVQMGKMCKRISPAIIEGAQSGCT